MNEKAQKIADLLGVWVARNKNGYWLWHEHKPRILDSIWGAGGGSGIIPVVGGDDWETSLHCPNREIKQGTVCAFWNDGDDLWDLGLYHSCENNVYIRGKWCNYSLIQSGWYHHACPYDPATMNCPRSQWPEEA